MILRRLGWVADEDLSSVGDAHWMQPGYEHHNSKPVATLAPESDGTGAYSSSSGSGGDTDSGSSGGRARPYIARGRVASLSLLGHSMGGGLSVVLAAALGPKIVSRLCLVEGSGLLSKPGATAAIDVLSALHSRARAESRLDAVFGQQSFVFPGTGGVDDVPSSRSAMAGLDTDRGASIAGSLDKTGDSFGVPGSHGILALGREFESLGDAITARCETVKTFPGDQSLSLEAAAPIV